MINLALEEFFEFFASCLIEWKNFSLVSKNTLNDVYGWHFVEALSIINLLDIKDDIIDFGAGGGVIGGVLQKCGFNVSFVDRSSNKLFFLKHIMKFSNVFHNIEDFSNKLVVIRGVSSVLSLLRILMPCKKLILFKSYSVNSEIKDALNYYDFKYEFFDRQGNAKGKIVVISNIKLRKKN